MKNFLAIDTSSKYMTVIAAKGEKIFSSFLSDCAMKHSVLLMKEIDKVLKNADMLPSDCDFFAAVVGAGSFTGIRIGIATAKGFCLAEGKPSLPVTSFEVMAYNALDGEKVLCLADALHGHYYACGFSEVLPCGNGGCVAGEPVDKRRQIFPPSYLSEEEVVKRINEEGYKAYALENIPLAERAEITVVDPVEGLIRAVLARSLSAENFGELNAMYIRKSQAEENLAPIADVSRRER